MSVLVSPLAGTTLNTASGFLQAEVYNMGMFSTTDSAALSTALNIAVTFTTGSRNNAGVILALESSAATIDRLIRTSLQQIMGTCTISVASPAVVTFASHGLTGGEPIRISSSGALPTFATTYGRDGSGNNYPTGTSTLSSVYFVEKKDDNSFYLHQTAALGGRINTSGTQSGTHTLYVDRGVSEQTAAAVYNNTTAHYSSVICPFAWAAYAIDTTASKWRFHAFQYGGTTGNWTLRTSNGTAPFYCEISSIAATFNDNDCVVCYGPVSVDKTATVKGVLGTGDSTYGVAICICKSAASITPTSGNENLIWDGSAARTLTIDGGVLGAFHSGFRAGASALSPVTAANMGTMAFTVPTVGTWSGPCDPEIATTTATNSRKMSWTIYGQIPTVERTTFVGDISVGATQFTTAVSTGWVNGDKIAIGKATTAGSGDATIYTVDHTDGETVYLTSGIVASMGRTGGGSVFRFNGYGFKVTGPSSGSVTSITWRFPSNFTMSGVEIAYINGTSAYETIHLTRHLAGGFVLDDAANMSDVQITHCSLYNPSANAGIYVGPSENDFYITYCNAHASHINASTYRALGSGDFVFTHNVQMNCGTSRTCVYTCTGCVCTDNRVEGHSYLAAALAGIGVTFQNNYFWGCSSTTYGPVYLNGTLINPNWSGNQYENCAHALYLGGTCIGQSLGDVFGSERTNTLDVDFMADAFIDFTMVSPEINLAISTTNQTLISTGSHLRFKQYDETANDFRAYYPEGRFVNPSQGATIQQVSNSGTNLLTNSYYVATGAVTDFKIGAFIIGQIGNAAYYAGTYTLPKFQAYYDAGSTVDDSLAASTDSQTLSCILTPTTDYNDLRLDLITATDAADANAGVTWSDLVVNVRKYGYVFGAYPITINQTTESYLANITTPAANPYITQATKGTVDAYTGISINHGTQTVTLSESHTEKELYDFAQSDLTADANMGYAEWFTTIDGVNYESAYDIELATGVALTGGGSVEMASGKTFTKTGTATYDGIIIYADASREVHLLLNGLAAGSTVQVYDNDNTTELYNDVVDGTSLDYVYTWTVDTELRIRVRKEDYIPYEYTGDIVQTGLTLNISQVANSIYTYNGIDGSTVTEFSLDGGTIEIFVDDPDNTTSAQRMYNWYMYSIATTTYIGIQPYDITAQTAWSYVLADELLIKNLDLANPLFMSGANLNNVTGNGQIIDTAGGSIIINGYFPFRSASDIVDLISDNADVQAIVADTNEIQAELADGGRTDLLIDALGSPMQAGASVTLAADQAVNVTKWGGSAVGGMPNSGKVAVSLAAADVSGNVPADVKAYTVQPTVTGATLDAAYDAAKTSAQAGDAMTLTSDYDAAKSAAAQSSLEDALEALDQILGAVAGKHIIAADGLTVAKYDKDGNLLVTLTRSGAGPYTWSAAWE